MTVREILIEYNQGLRKVATSTREGFLKGWAADREIAKRYLPVWTWRQRLWANFVAYVSGQNPRITLIFMKDQFTMREVETLVSSVPEGLGPIMIQRVQVTTNVPNMNGEQPPNVSAPIEAAAPNG